MSELIKAFFLIFVAEMGDKTQIMAMAFATQYAVRGILAGVFIGSFLNHGIAIVLGALFLSKIPVDLLQLCAGALFIFFGLMSLDIEEGEDDAKAKKAKSAVVTVALAFFLGELGDKTQLTAMTLGSSSTMPAMTLLGSSLGMVAVSSFGIFIGAKLGNKIPEHYMKLSAFAVFMAFGLSKVYTSAYVTVAIGSVVAVVLAGLSVYRGLRFKRQLQTVRASALKSGAMRLKAFREEIKRDVDALCKNCSACKSGGCMVKHVQLMLDDVPELSTLVKVDLEALDHEALDLEKAQAIEDKINQFYSENPDVKQNHEALQHVHEAISHMLTEHH